MLRQKAHHKLTFCSVFPLPLLFRRLFTVFFIDKETNETIPLHFWNVFPFFNEKKLFEKNFSPRMCARRRSASCKKRREFCAKLTHFCGFWLDVSFFSHVKKHRSRFWLDVSFFSRVKTIVRSSDWLELICVRKFTYTMYFSWLSNNIVHSPLKLHFSIWTCYILFRSLARFMFIFETENRIQLSSHNTGQINHPISFLFKKPITSWFWIDIIASLRTN